MKKTTSSLFAATAALGLIAASAGVAFAAEIPDTEPSAPATSAPADETPAPEQPSTEDPATEDPAPEPSTPADDNTGADDNNTGGSAEMPPASDDSSAPAADQGGAGAVSGPVGNAGVSTRGQIATGKKGERKFAQTFCQTYADFSNLSVYGAVGILVLHLMGNKRHHQKHDDAANIRQQLRGRIAAKQRRHQLFHEHE